jgi:hypothetical protein
MRAVALTFIFIASLAISCNKLDQLDESPELQPLAQGFQATAAIGYCASVAVSAFTGETLPSNVTFEPKTEDGYTNAGVIRINVTASNPLPFNSHIGDIFIAGLWDGNSGVISIIFADIDILSSNFEFYGLHTVPIFKDASGDIRTLFAQQDIVIGQGSDTLLSLSMSKPKFDLEQQRLNSSYPGDVFAAVSQKVWFMDIERNNLDNVYDDFYTVNGGGQVLEARSSSGGILYHAMIDTEFSFADCEVNPTDGTAFIQNIKAGSTIDLGNITFNFHGDCDGQADVIVATGKYVGSNGKSINLNFN